MSLLSTSQQKNNGGGLLLQNQQRHQHICITGSSQGIGLAAATRLVAQGHTVYHACRTRARADHAVKLAGGGIPMTCDLADLESVRDFARDLTQRAVKLDVLCLNAGVAPSSSAMTPKLTKDGYEESIGVNHIGHFLLANLLYSKLKANGGGRLVLTASSVHDPDTPGGKSGGQGATLGNLSGLGVNLAINPNGSTMVDGVIEFNGGKAYKDSKLCNILFCREAVKRLPGIDVMCFNPGFMPSTGLFQSLRTESWWKAQALMAMAWAGGYSVPVQVGGDRLVYMATNRSIPSGAYLSNTVGSKAITQEDGFASTSVSTEASSDTVAALLWEKSSALVGKWLK